MPELPEVETVRRGLLPHLIGRTVARVCIAPDRVPLVPDSDPETFARALTGRRFEEVRRHGKYLLFRMSGGRWWVAHLRMTGNVALRAAGDPPEPHQRAVVGLDDGRELRWSDLRKFGTWRLLDDPGEITCRLGADGLDRGSLTPAYLAAKAARRRTPAKSFLLDQAAVAGLGNIYADEVLFAARVPPWKLARDLTEDEVRRLAEAIPLVLERALGHGGTSFRNFVDVAGVLGRYLDAAWVHRRAGAPCPACGTAVERGKIGGRSTYWCPRCQSG